jgi:crotonobetainyl-CoA:carnitine CoA-transferase CaiB-like acyl-CoA transferase
MKNFGFDYETLSAINPRIIYMSISAFGNEGPAHDEPGFDPILQARSGAMAAQGGHNGHPVYLTSSVCDYGAAMLAAWGCVLALRARERTGRGQLVETSLLQSSMALQAGEFVFYDGRPDMENGTPEYRGHGAISRCYRCADARSVHLSIADANQWEGLRRVTSAKAISFTEALNEPPDGTLAAALAEFFAKLECQEAVRILGNNGVPAVAVNRLKHLFDDPQVAANELLVEVRHPQWGSVIQTGLLAKFSGTIPPAPRAAPLLGEHTEAILSSLDYSADRIADLKNRKIIKTP